MFSKAYKSASLVCHQHKHNKDSEAVYTRSSHHLSKLKLSKYLLSFFTSLSVSEKWHTLVWAQQCPSPWSLCWGFCLLLGWGHRVASSCKHPHQPPQWTPELDLCWLILECLFALLCSSLSFPSSAIRFFYWTNHIYCIQFGQWWQSHYLVFCWWNHCYCIILFFSPNYWLRCGSLYELTYGKWDKYNCSLNFSFV